MTPVYYSYLYIIVGVMDQNWRKTSPCIPMIRWRLGVDFPYLKWPEAKSHERLFGSLYFPTKIYPYITIYIYRYIYPHKSPKFRWFENDWKKIGPSASRAPAGVWDPIVCCLRCSPMWLPRWPLMTLMQNLRKSHGKMRKACGKHMENMSNTCGKHVENIWKTVTCQTHVEK